MANEIPQGSFQRLVAALAAHPQERLRLLYDSAREGLRSDPTKSEAQVDFQAEQIVKAIIWLEEKWSVGRECPYCANAEWEVGTPVEITTGSVMATTPILSQMSPMFPVMCTNCGNTVLVNAIRAGIAPEQRRS